MSNPTALFLPFSPGASDRPLAVELSLCALVLPPCEGHVYRAGTEPQWGGRVFSVSPGFCVFGGSALVSREDLEGASLQ